MSFHVSFYLFQCLFVPDHHYNSDNEHCHLSSIVIMDVFPAFLWIVDLQLRADGVGGVGLLARSFGGCLMSLQSHTGKSEGFCLLVWRVCWYIRKTLVGVTLG